MATPDVRGPPFAALAKADLLDMLAWRVVEMRPDTAR